MEMQTEDIMPTQLHHYGHEVDEDASTDSEIATSYFEVQSSSSEVQTSSSEEESSSSEVQSSSSEEESSSSEVQSSISEVQSSNSEVQSSNSEVQSSSSKGESTSSEEESTSPEEESSDGDEEMSDVQVFGERVNFVRINVDDMSEDEYDYSDDMYEDESGSEDAWCDYEELLRDSLAPQFTFILNSIKNSNTNNPSLSSSSYNVIKKAIHFISEARADIEAECWVGLWHHLQEVDKLLFSNDSFNHIQSLGLLLPILSRMFNTIEKRLIKDPIIRTKNFRREIGKHRAKALHILNQKWPKMWKQRNNIIFKQIISEHSIHQPDFIHNVDDIGNQKALDSLEDILLGTVVGLSINDINIKKIPQALIKIFPVVQWYFSFLPKFLNQPTHSTESETTCFLNSIKFLDLSCNQLTTFEDKLPLLLPELEMLDISYNPISAFPRTCTRWTKLERLRVVQPIIERNKPTKTDTKDLLLRLPIPTLVENCLKRLKQEMNNNNNNTLVELVPDHLEEALIKGRTCESCHCFLWPNVKPFYHNIHFLNNSVYPGANKRIPCGPSFYCNNCIHYHVVHQLKDRNCQCEMCIFDRLHLNQNLWVFHD